MVAEDTFKLKMLPAMNASPVSLDVITKAALMVPGAVTPKKQRKPLSVDEKDVLELSTPTTGRAKSEDRAEVATKALRTLMMQLMFLPICTTVLVMLLAPVHERIDEMVGLPNTARTWGPLTMGFAAPPIDFNNSKVVVGSTGAVKKKLKVRPLEVEDSVGTPEPPMLPAVE